MLQTMKWSVQEGTDTGARIILLFVFVRKTKSEVGEEKMFILKEGASIQIMQRR